MSCEEYIGGQEASVLLKLATSEAPFGHVRPLKDELAGTESFAKLSDNVDVEKAAAFFTNSTSD